MTNQDGSIPTFQELGIQKPLLDTLGALSFNTPTPIQISVVPTALNGSDILASSKTGSGKTLAFSLPLISKLISSREEIGLVVAPTREIAIQISKVIQSLTPKTDLHYALLIGGEPMPRQFDQLKRSPRIIIGTPGRINDHLSRGRLRLEKVGIVVLDEADRMLDMGFDVQIEEIFTHIPVKCQKLMFSATMPKKIEKLAQKYLQNAVLISTTTANEDSHHEVKNVKQDFHHLDKDSKYSTLLKELEVRDGHVVIFVNTKRGVEDISYSLKIDNHNVDFIHGDLKQSVRSKVISNFREKKYRILIATDIVARGLDVPHIQHVINFDMPTSFDEYIHRIGRTNRQSGMEGSIVNFITPSRDAGIANEIHAKLGHKEAQVTSHKAGGDDRHNRRRKPFFKGSRNFNSDRNHNRRDNEKSWNNDKPKKRW